MFWTDVQGLLNAGSGVIKEAEQGMIALAKQGRFVGLSQNGGNLFRLQITDRAFDPFLGRNMKHLSAESCRGGLAIGNEKEETPQGRKSAVAGRDRSAASGLDVLEERSHLVGGQLIQRKLGHRTASAIRHKAEE